MDLHKTLVEVLFGGKGPFADPCEDLPQADLSSYPHTHLHESLVEQLMAALLEQDEAASSGPLLVIELGSFVGGSAVRIARALKRLGRCGRNSALVCIDPFCGDSNMWANHNGWRSWLQLRGGRPRLFEQFIACLPPGSHVTRAVDCPPRSVLSTVREVCAQSA